MVQIPIASHQSTLYSQNQKEPPTIDSAEIKRLCGSKSRYTDNGECGIRTHVP